jgi:hypothetical protein
MEAPAWLKPAILGGVAGAIATIVVGFKKLAGRSAALPRRWLRNALPRP